MHNKIVRRNNELIQNVSYQVTFLHNMSWQQLCLLTNIGI